MFPFTRVPLWEHMFDPPTANRGRTNSCSWDWLFIPVFIGWYRVSSIATAAGFCLSTVCGWVFFHSLVERDARRAAVAWAPVFLTQTPVSCLEGGVGVLGQLPKYGCCEWAQSVFSVDLPSTVAFLQMQSHLVVQLYRHCSMSPQGNPRDLFRLVSYRCHTSLNHV